MSLVFFSYNLIGDDYILNLTGKRVYDTQHNYTKKDNYRVFKLEGAFTDNFGNYGNWSTIVNAEIENNILKYHAFSLKYSYQDGSIVFAKGNRTNEELEQGIGKANYISAPKKLSSLIGTVCNYGVNFLKETAFVIFKCNSTIEAKKSLTSISKKQNCQIILVSNTSLLLVQTSYSTLMQED